MGWESLEFVGEASSKGGRLVGEAGRSSSPFFETVHHFALWHLTIGLSYLGFLYWASFEVVPYRKKVSDWLQGHLEHLGPCFLSFFWRAFDLQPCLGAHLLGLIFGRLLDWGACYWTRRDMKRLIRRFLADPYSDNSEPLSKSTKTFALRIPSFACWGFSYTKKGARLFGTVLQRTGHTLFCWRLFSVTGYQGISTWIFGIVWHLET